MANAPAAQGLIHGTPCQRCRRIVWAGKYKRADMVGIAHGLHRIGSGRSQGENVALIILGAPGWNAPSAVPALNVIAWAKVELIPARVYGLLNSAPGTRQYQLNHGLNLRAEARRG